MLKIYIDVYFVINLALDYLALFSSQKILFLPESHVKCFIGALIGAFYSTANIVFSFPLGLHIAISFIMVSLITVKKSTLYKLGALAIFSGAEIFIGGFVWALKNLSALFPKKGVALAAVIILISVLGNKFYTLSELVLKKRMSTLGVNAKISHRGKSCNVLLMMDSGNLVRESSTRKRVIFVRADSIKECTGETDTIFEREKCYVIPIDTASGKGSVMGFIPDKVEFKEKKYNSEEFIVVPDANGGKYGGFDGIAPLL